MNHLIFKNLHKQIKISFFSFVFFFSFSFYLFVSLSHFTFLYFRKSYHNNDPIKSYCLNNSTAFHPVQKKLMEDTLKMPEVIHLLIPNLNIFKKQMWTFIIRWFSFFFVSFDKSLDCKKTNRLIDWLVDYLIETWVLHSRVFNRFCFWWWCELVKYKKKCYWLIHWLICWIH